MAPSKEEEAKREARETQDTDKEVLPAYEEFSGSSTAPPSEIGTHPALSATSPTAYTAHTVSPISPTSPDSTLKGPTIATPFNFPSDSDLPSYAASSADTSMLKPLVIPQIAPDPKAPFLDAYSDVLLRHGVTAETWANFLHTLSGFLAATVSDKAVSHAGQVARHLGRVPRKFGRDTVAHAKATGHAIAESARKGNYIGAAAHTIVGGAFALPLATTIRVIAATFSLPFAAADGAAADPETPRERAEAYARAANAKWLHRRGLEAHLLETGELAQALGLNAEGLVDLVLQAKTRSADAQMRALGAHVAEVQVREGAMMELGKITYWLVVTAKPDDDESDKASEMSAGTEKGKGKGKWMGMKDELMSMGKGKEKEKEKDEY